ncbi:ftsK/SpoIIIE family protein [Geobacillus kaustophilus]|uniref:FtsK/SpoIIIE family protein n=2 Tax=Geobacillus kaustophilus TaxID=1462 RepID=A0A0D8BPH0_GEOKU|nr:DNA translocase FtsK [Geobacillus kaustophilus]KJE26108.1 ftsK/SpoIIIE family protein [Geobacillus kaustophilus]
MKFWKRWLRFLTSEAEEEGNEQRTNSPLSAGMPERGEADVIYRYPQGRFRFPLIPDDELAEEGERPRRAKSEESGPLPNRRPSAGAAKVTAEKRLFRPSDVPSPIFGYDRNRGKQRQRVDEIEPTGAVDAESQCGGAVREEAIRGEATWRGVREDTENWAAEPPKEEESLAKRTEAWSEEDDDASGAMSAAVVETEGKDEPAPAAGQEESRAEANEEKEQELDERGKERAPHATDGGLESEGRGVPSQKRNGDGESASSTERRETTPDREIRRSAAQAGREEASRPERTRIPYNVIMLKQDWRKLEEKTANRSNSYVRPPLALLEPPEKAAERDEQWLREQCQRLDRTFASFHIGAKVVGATQGPTVTRFEVQPDLGVKVSKITSLIDDIKLSLAAKDIRMEAPIPGKRTIGIEVPNRTSRPVRLREILESEAFRKSPSPLTVALGLDISGAPVVTDIRKMPHGLIAGATGSGKSVCMNAMLVSMLYKAAPHEVKWLLIDPKMVELAPYNGLPHLLSPVITEAKAAAGALKWAVGEMERRYEQFVHAGVRDIEKYNSDLHERGSSEPPLPYIVIVIDELADLMMAAPADVEESICRLAQKARACGIHLLIATQRPSVDVLTGLIKANIPTRIAFSVSSQVDSRTILDVNGAERLLGRGDMLFLENGSAKPVRLQGCFISDGEIERVAAHVKAEQGPSYLFDPDDFRQTASMGGEDDELFEEACRFVIAQGGASTSSLQRHFRIGYNRAARLIEMMEERGLISEARGSKPRDVLMSKDEWERWHGQNS